MSKPKLRVKSIDLSELLESLGDKKAKGSRALELLGDDVPDEVKEALVTIIDGVASAEGRAGAKFKTGIEAQAELLKYMAMPLPKQGSFIERNEFGKARYKCPDGDVEAGLVVEVFPYRQEVDGEGCVNGVVAFCDRQGIIRTHAVDLRMYKEIEAVKVTAAH